MILITNSILFSTLKHPIAIGITLIISTTSTSIAISLISNSPWFAYILFLVFLGGVLVLFAYVTSLTPNEIFSIKQVNIQPIIILPLIILLIILMDPLLISTSTSLENISPLLKENSEIPILKFYNKSLLIITLSLASYLFITLIAVVKITDLNKGPLRRFKTYVNPNTNSLPPS